MPLLPDLTLPIISSALVGGSIWLLSAWILWVLRREDLQQADEWRYDVSRVNELRRQDDIFRLFQPVVESLAKLNRVLFARFLPQIGQDLAAAGKSRFWLPEEYLARLQLIALALFPLLAYACLRFLDLPGIVLALALTGVIAWLLRRRLAAQARYRVMLIKRRMPFLLDLLTLLMEAGSTFLQSLAQAVDELRGHPVSTEFGRVLTDINMGKTRTQALSALRDRLGDDEVSGILGAIIQSEELGTPLGRIFRTQSDVLRIKRTQRAESIAGEAGVNMLLPGILVMMSTVLIIFGPFILNYLYSGLSL